MAKYQLPKFVLRGVISEIRNACFTLPPAPGGLEVADCEGETDRLALRQRQQAATNDVFRGAAAAKAKAKASSSIRRTANATSERASDFARFGRRSYEASKLHNERAGGRRGE